MAGWTQEQNDLLIELAKTQKLTASEIGRKVGKTRSAVIGKCHRLKLALPCAVGATGPRRTPTVPRRPAPLVQLPPLRLAEKPVQALLDPDVPTYRADPEPQRCATPRPGASHFSTCQWYFGDPKAGDMSKCSQPTAGASSFCEEHHRRVYVPAQPKTVRKA